MTEAIIGVPPEHFLGGARYNLILNEALRYAEEVKFPTTNEN